MSTNESYCENLQQVFAAEASISEEINVNSKNGNITSKAHHAELKDQKLVICKIDNDLIQHEVHIDDIVGCSFIINVEPMDIISGMVTIVTKKVSFSASDCHSWILIFSLATVIYITCFFIVGPWSAIFMMSLWISTTFNLTQGFSKEKNENLDKILLCYFTRVISICITMIFIYLCAMSTAAQSSTSIGISVSLILLVSLNICLNNSMIPIPPIPKVQRPIVLQYYDEDILELILLRKQFYHDDKLRFLITRVWIGGSHVEAALSFIIPSDIYNSQPTRRFLYVLANYLLPIYTVMRGLGALIPPCEYLFTCLIARTRRDIGLGLLYLHSRIVWTRAYGILNKFYNLCLLPMDKLILINFMNNFQKLFQPFYSVLFLNSSVVINQLISPYVILFKFINQLVNYIGSIVHAVLGPFCSILRAVCWPLYFAGVQAYFLFANVIFSFWMVLRAVCWPFYLVGVQIYFLFSAVVSSLVSVGKSLNQLFAVSVTVIYNSLMQQLKLLSQIGIGIVRLYKDHFVRPMPAPNYAQLTKNVVSSSSKLIQHVKHLGAPNILGKSECAGSRRSVQSSPRSVTPLSSAEKSRSEDSNSWAGNGNGNEGGLRHRRGRSLPSVEDLGSLFLEDINGCFGEVKVNTSDMDIMLTDARLAHRACELCCNSVVATDDIHDVSVIAVVSKPIIYLDENTKLAGCGFPMRGKVRLSPGDSSADDEESEGKESLNDIGGIEDSLIQAHDPTPLRVAEVNAQALQGSKVRRDSF